MTYHDGDRVILPADPDEGIPEERCVVLGEGEDDVYVVQVDEPAGPDDHDRLREVHADQMRPEVPTGLVRKAKNRRFKR